MVDFEEPGVINPDGLGAVVSGMAGVYSLQWVTEEEAAVVGTYRLDIRLLFTDGLKIIFSIQSEMLKRPIQLRLLTVHTSCNLVTKVTRFTYLFHRFNSLYFDPPSLQGGSCGWPGHLGQGNPLLHKDLRETKVCHFLIFSHEALSI